MGKSAKSRFPPPSSVRFRPHRNRKSLAVAPQRCSLGSSWRNRIRKTPSCQTTGIRVNHSHKLMLIKIKTCSQQLLNSPPDPLLDKICTNKGKSRGQGKEARMLHRQPSPKSTRRFRCKSQSKFKVQASHRRHSLFLKIWTPSPHTSPNLQHLALVLLLR